MKNTTNLKRQLFAGLLILAGLATSQSPVPAEEKPGAWWEAETAMGKGGLLELTNKSWWPRAKELKAGEHFVVKSDQPGGGSILVRREQWKTRGKTLEAIVCVIDDDGDFKSGDKDGDKDSDCYVADYGGDGKVDRMVDYIDNDGDGKPDEMDIRYFVDGCLRRAWFGVDLDKDGHMWNIDQYEYKGNFFLCDPYGDNMIYFNGYDAVRGEWFPASECPFDFHDTDGDGQSEAVVRVSGVHLSYDPKKEYPDVANNVNTSSDARSEKTRRMGALNVRYGIDIDDMSSDKRPLHYDMGFNLIGRQPYEYEGMRRTNPLRRAPKTTICLPHESTRKMAETYPAEQTGFSWREFRDDARRLGHGPLADEGRRWEGIFWTWSRRVMHNTGGPTQAWNMRREFRPTPSTRRELYYSSVDRRIHLKGATEGWIRIGHFGNREPLAEVRYFDTDKDGYFDRWEVYREGTALPVRTSTVRDPKSRDLSTDWDKLIEFYTKELLPEAIKANETIMAAMRRADPKYIVPSELQAALKSSHSDTEKRYIQDIIREYQYGELRAKLLAKSAKMMERPSWESRRLHPSPPSVDGWKLALQLSELDTAYGEGRYKDAVKLLEAIAAEQKESAKETTDKATSITPKPAPQASQGVWYTPGVAEGYGRVRPDKSYPSVKYSCVYPGKPTVYSGPMATYCAWHRPMAVYAPEKNKTFFVFGNSRNSPSISFYDHGKKTYAKPVVLGTNPNGDAHRNPTLLVDEKGFLYVFYGAHGHPSRVVKSAAPYDISKWTKMADIQDRNTYPQPWQLNKDELFVSYRGTPPGWYYRKSTDGAATWQPHVNLIQFGENATYAVTVAETGAYPRKIHIAWERMGGGTEEEIRTKALWARRYNVYYACSDDGGSTWQRSDGSKYRLPITEAAAEKIHDSGTRGVWLKDIQLDPNGKPYILFIDADVRTYQSKCKVARLDKSGWRTAYVAVSDHMYDGGALLALDENDIRVYAPTTAVQDHEDGGEIEEWRSNDGGDSWTNTRHVTTGSKLSHNHVKTVFNQRQGDFRMMWNYGDSVFPPSTKDVYLYHFGEALARPAKMRFGPARSIVQVAYTTKNKKNGKIVVGLDRYYNNETRNGRPYHYAWDDKSSGGYSKLRELIQGLGAKTVSVPTAATPASLAGLDIYLIVDPDTPKETPKPNYIEDKHAEAIADWVKGGGVLLLQNNNQGETEFKHINKLAARFGITFNEDTRLGIDADAGKLERQLHSLPDHPMFKGVKKLHMRSLCTLGVKPPARELYNLEGDCFMAVAPYGKGFVLAVGDPWGYNEYIEHADNRRCLKNTFEWLMKKTR